jgi:DNA-binding PadR family transcriptional regulator
MIRDTNQLPHTAFGILLALSLKPRHGYEIMKQVEVDSGGKIKLGPGALYTSIKTLLEDGLIEEMPEAGRRRSYKLTNAGRRRLGQELSYYETTLQLARQRKVLQTHYA